jgi:transcriptional regulator with XRE-family HTH domain
VTGQQVARVSEITPGVLVADDEGIGLWLRRQREAHGWSKREQARQLIKAGRDSGDTSMPGVDSLVHNVNRWERGDNEPTERYRLYYCKSFGIPAGQFGRDAPVADSLFQAGTGLNAPGMSVSVQFASGRLVIEVSGFGAQEEREPEPALTVVAPSSQRGITVDARNAAGQGTARGGESRR